MDKGQFAYTYDYYQRLRRVTKSGLDQKLDNYRTYPLHHSIINEVAYTYYYIHDYYDALEYVYKACQLDELDERESYFTYKLGGDVFYRIGIWDKAIEFYERSIEVMGRLDRNRKLSSVYRSMALTYIKKQQSFFAKKYVAMAMETAKESVEPVLEGLAYQTQSKLDLLNGEVENAKESILTSIKLFKELQDNKNLIVAWMDLANIYVESNDMIMAQQFLDKSRELAWKEEFLEANIYTYLMNGNLALSREAHDEALLHAEQGLKVSREHYYMEHKKGFYSLLAKIYEKQGQFELAYTALKEAAPQN